MSNASSNRSPAAPTALYNVVFGVAFLGAVIGELIVWRRWRGRANPFAEARRCARAAAGFAVQH